MDKNITFCDLCRKPAACDSLKDIYCDAGKLFGMHDNILSLHCKCCARLPCQKIAANILKRSEELIARAAV